ncbi:hypothetical protein C5S35_12295 [Candidatus Methanophagaceae archaeon]|nr:hypothetical protein C5S35_12295 [Methanophagales archaeon]
MKNKGIPMTTLIQALRFKTVRDISLIHIQEKEE